MRRTTASNNAQADGTGIVPSGQNQYKDRAGVVPGTDLEAADENQKQEELVQIIEAFGKLPNAARAQIKTILLSAIGNIQNADSGRLLEVRNRTDNGVTDPTAGATHHADDKMDKILSPTELVTNNVMQASANLPNTDLLKGSGARGAQTASTKVADVITSPDSSTSAATITELNRMIFWAYDTNLASGASVTVTYDNGINNIIPSPAANSPLYILVSVTNSNGILASSGWRRFTAQNTALVVATGSNAAQTLTASFSTQSVNRRITFNNQLSVPTNGLTIMFAWRA